MDRTLLRHPKPAAHALTLGVVALLAISSSPARAQLAGLLTKGLPSGDRSMFDGMIAPVLTDLQGRPAIRSATKLPIRKKLFRGTLVYDWALQPAQGGFPGFWQGGEGDAGVQIMVNWTAFYLDSLLKARGFDVENWVYAEAHADSASLGHRPTPYQARNMAGKRINSASYVEKKRKEFGPGDFEKLNGTNEFDGAVFIHVNGLWDYDGHVAIDGEAIAVHAVFEQFVITVCPALGKCKTTPIAINNPFKSKRPMTSSKIIDKDKHKELERWVTHSSAQLTAQTLATALDAFIGVAK